VQRISGSKLQCEILNTRVATQLNEQAGLKGVRVNQMLITLALTRLTINLRKLRRKFSAPEHSSSDPDPERLEAKARLAQWQINNGIQSETSPKRAYILSASVPCIIVAY
jgi:hypothetical protein